MTPEDTMSDQTERDTPPDPWANIEAELLKAIGYPHVTVADLPPDTFVARFYAARQQIEAQHAAQIADLTQKLADADLAFTRAGECLEKQEVELDGVRSRLTAVEQERYRATDALRKLRNESHAIESLSYDEIKESAGYTNLKVWLTRIEEADAVLAALTPTSPQTPEDRT